MRCIFSACALSPMPPASATSLPCPSSHIFSRHSTQHPSPVSRKHSTTAGTPPPSTSCLAAPLSTSSSASTDTTCGSSRTLSTRSFTTPGSAQTRVLHTLLSSSSASRASARSRSRHLPRTFTRSVSLACLRRKGVVLATLELHRVLQEAHCDFSSPLYEPLQPICGNDLLDYP